MTVIYCEMEDGPPMAVEMPSATSARYAAKRVAEAVGMDPNYLEWRLVLNGKPMKQDATIAEYEDKVFRLGAETNE